MSPTVLNFHEIDRAQVLTVGGKGAHLAELSRIEGIRVPAGFCVTTDAYRRFAAQAEGFEALVDRLSPLAPDDLEAIRSLSASIRATLQETALPDDIAASIQVAAGQLGERAACAVRSSATAEDLPSASFAGQQDTYLNVAGPAAILEHVRQCWASLFTERAVVYRMRHRFDHRRVQMAVVVQRMVFPQAAGVLFTADPVTGHRQVALVEAGFGLGEALVSGHVNADVYRLRGGRVIDRTIGVKRMAVVPAPTGGTRQQPLDPECQQRPVLNDEQAAQLVACGRRIEAHFGAPQDIEWCLADGEFHFVQSRPITTLFPIPPAGDGRNHVYISVGHQQMMTDAMKPLGLSVWQMTTPKPMAEAGGRLFVDVTPILASPRSRAGFLALMRRSDPLMVDALQTVIERGDFVPALPDEGAAWSAPGAGAAAAIEADPALVDRLIAHSQASLDRLRREIEGQSGPALFDLIATDMRERRGGQFHPQSVQAIMAGMEAAWWLNEHLQRWLGEPNAADRLALSVPNNVTAQMGLALLDVADAIRPHPEVVAFLQQARDDHFLDALPRFAGGAAARVALQGWLDRYGMRGAGEIDITRPRWSERPTMLLPSILSNIRGFEPGAAARRFDEGRRLAARAEDELLSRLRALPDGAQKAEETRRMIHRLRTFAGYREYPKYAMVSRYFVYKQALLQEAERLVQAGVLRDAEDIFYLRFEELRAVVSSHRVDEHLIAERKAAFASYQALTPPRVLTSDGEAVAGAYRGGQAPAGALVGLPVSAGVVEGRARIVLDMAQADLQPGDILVTAHTDPSWTPLFVVVGGLVTEVGGLMTHGAVVAREYGLPAVVGVEQATRLIREGQRIRVDGSAGTVEVLPDC